MCFSESTQNFIEKSLKIIWLAYIWLFHKRLIKVVIYSLVYNSFYGKGPLFVYWSIICIFQTIGERSRFWYFIYTHSFIILFMVSEDTWLNENSLLFLNFSFIVFILRWEAIFLIMELNVSFPDDIEVSSSQLKRFNESVIDPECLLKIAATSFCLITFYPFQATL